MVGGGRGRRRKEIDESRRGIGERCVREGRRRKKKKEIKKQETERNKDMK